MKFGEYYIRSIDAGDAAAYHRFVNRNVSRILRYFPGTPFANRDLKSTESFIKGTIERRTKREFDAFVIYSEKGIGICGVIFLKNVDWNVGKCELSFFMDGEQEGKGIITKGVSVVIGHCFSELGLNKVFLRIAEDNIASRRVAEKNGFMAEGVLRSDYRAPDGELIDIVYYGLLKEPFPVK